MLNPEVNKIIQRLQIPNYVEISLEGFSGRLWLLQTHKVHFQLDIIHTSNRIVHCQIQDIIKNISWLGTLIYR